MAAKRKGIMDVRQILLLKKKGLSNRKVEYHTGIHRNTVNAYVRLFESSQQSYSKLLKLSDVELESFFPMHSSLDKARYAELSAHFTYFDKELKKPGCTRKALWQEYLQKHPDGYGKSQFNEHLNRWMNRVKGSGKLIHKAGEKLLVDYTGKKLFIVDKQTGEQIQVEVFVAILPCSQMTYVEASASQKREDFINSMNNCLEYLEGVPQAIVPDNLKSAVSKGCKYEPVINKTFKDFALHYGCAINPTRTYSPQDKALVESTVKLVYQRIFYPLSKMTFFSLDELNQAIHELLDQYNDQLLTHLNVSRRAQFHSVEKAQLSALPIERYEIKTYKRATVQQMGYIFLSADKNYYSVPHRFIGKQVEVRYDRTTVEIYSNHQRIAIHNRSQQRGQYTTIKDHLSSSHNFYQRWSPQYFEHMASRHGNYVREYIKGLIEQAAYPEVAYKQCLGIIHLNKTFSSSQLNKVCKLAMGQHRRGYQIIKTMLTNKMYLQDDMTTKSSNHIPDHDNILGSDHFNSLLNQKNEL